MEYKEAMSLDEANALGKEGWTLHSRHAEHAGTLYLMQRKLQEPATKQEAKAKKE